MTYVPPYELTKIDIAALRHADHIVAWLDCNGVVGSLFEAVKRAEKTEKNPFATDIRHEIPAPVRTVFDYRDENATWSCVESVTFYRSQACQASSALATLRAGDAIALQFYPDSHTTQALKEHGFHGDAWNLLVYRKDKLVATFELRSSICQDNSARMCKRITKQYALTA
jgi:hypothetical protein